jgi:transposase
MAKAKVAKEPAKRGQPTKYRPEYCEKVVAWGKEGLSIAQMCAEIGVTYNTIQVNWPKAFPEFKEAMELWEVHAQAYWEAKIPVNLTNREFQAHLYLRSMAARFPKHWRESTRSELTGADGAPLNPSPLLPDVSHLDEEQLAVLASIRLKADDRDGEEATRH